MEFGHRDFLNLSVRMKIKGLSPVTKKQSSIEKILKYSFQDKSLMNIALTHPSLEGEENYQRLEFLGDRVLGLVCARWMYEEYPFEREGDLSRRFIDLVRKETLAEVAENIKIGPEIRTSKTVGQDGKSNPAILSDVMEALIGALYLDGGLEVASAFIKKHWSEFLTRDAVAKDPKSALQEWAQGRGLPLPLYEVVERSGPDHQPQFTVKVSIKNGGQKIAVGPSKRLAETEAAELLLTELGKVGLNG